MGSAHVEKGRNSHLFTQQTILKIYRAPRYMQVYPDRAHRTETLNRALLKDRVNEYDGGATKEQ